MPEEFQVKFVTSADLAGSNAVKQSVQETSAELKNFSAEFDAAFSAIKGGLMSRVLKPEDKAALSGALDELKTELGEGFDSGNLEAFAAKVDGIKDRMLDLAHAGGTWNPAEDFEQAGAAAEKMSGGVRATDAQIKNAAQSGLQLIGALTTGEGAGTALVRSLGALGTVGTGIIGGGIITGLTMLVTNLVNAKAKADEFKLDQLKSEMKSAEASFAAFGASLRANFGAALEEQKVKLQEFLGEFKSAMESTGKGRERQDKEAASELKRDLAELENEKQMLLSGVEDPEARAAIEKDYAASAENLKAAEKWARLTRDAEKADQDLALANEGAANAEGQIKTGQGQIASGEQMKLDARTMMTRAGVYSDQDRVIDDWDALQRRQEQGPLDDADEKRRELLRAQIDRAREEKDAGTLTYDRAKDDKTLTGEQRRILEEGTAGRDMGDKQIEAGRGVISVAEKARRAALGEAAEARSRSKLSGEALATEENNEAAGALRGASTSAQRGASAVATEAQQLAVALDQGFSTIKSALAAVAGRVSTLEGSVNAAAGQARGAASATTSEASKSRFQKNYDE